MDATAFKPRGQIEPLTVLNPVSLAGRPVPPREWLVPDLIPLSTVTLTGGDGGTGKSLVMMQLAVAVATGNHWLGRPIGDGRALYLSAEDDADELHRRLFDICAEYVTSLDNLGRLKIVPLAGEDALLATANGASMKRSALFERLENLIEDWKPAVVVVDTLADVFGGNENNRSHARQFIGMLRGLAIRHHMAVVVLSHPSLTGISSGSGLSGSTAWNNSVRSRLYLDRVTDENGYEADTALRVLRTVKSNYGPTGDEIQMRWHAGVFIPVPISEVDETLSDARHERAFLECLDAYTAEGRYVSATPSANYAPKVFVADGRFKGSSKDNLQKAMNRLFERKEIVVEEHGSPSRKLKKIVRK